MNSYLFLKLNSLYVHYFFRFFILTLFLSTDLFSQPSSNYWQQRADYSMEIDFNHENHSFSGKQMVRYTNNSPDTLRVIYFHLYLNAFQPGSAMDERSRNIPDPDSRIKDRIQQLKENEIGYQIIKSIFQDGETAEFETIGTILRVNLRKDLQPGQTTELSLDFTAQVPVQIRRSGRNNIEGIDYSMAQWYPKIAEYDREGWHANTYIAREFYGVWGNFDVTILMDSAYTIAATGLLQNPGEIGKGYGKKDVSSQSAKLKWIFHAEQVHDFVWAADRDYIHDKIAMENGTELHFFYQNDTNFIKNWKALPEYTIRCFEEMNRLVGPYPYPSYSVIQAGDGGMEYPMATLILGNGKFNGLVSVMVHEAVHSWFQGVLGNNEGSYPWMDEGFNTYFNHIVMDTLFHRKNEFLHAGSYNSYFKLLELNEYEAIGLHSDHYNTNRAYGVAAYSMGCIFLNQLNYIIGSDNFDKTIHRYYNTWKFRHPDPTDFKRVAEKVSGMELDWYFNYFIHSSKKIDYAILEVRKEGKNCEIKLKRNGSFPMPVDIKLTLEDGQVKYYTIPLDLMMDSKKSDLNRELLIQPVWQWTNPEYILTVPFHRKEIRSIEIDAEQRMADVNRTDNNYPVKKTD